MSDKFFSLFSEPLELLDDVAVKSSHAGDAAESDSAKPAKVAKAAKIRGIISSEAVDHQGDTILQDGLDFSYFLNAGFLNDDHKPGASNVLGEPIEVSPVLLPDGKKATAMVGKLYLDKKMAREVYDTACAMKSASSKRRLGFSIEGQVLARDPSNPKIVTRARVLHVAITNAPVNPDATGLEILARSANGYDEEAAMKARKIIQENMELSDPRVYMEVQKQLNSFYGSTAAGNTSSAGASVGYQTPAQADPAAPLSPLVPSSTATRTSSAASPSLSSPKRKKNKPGDPVPMQMGGDPTAVAQPMTTPSSMKMGGDPTAVAQPVMSPSSMQMGGDPTAVAQPESTMMMQSDAFGDSNAGHEDYQAAANEVRTLLSSAAVHILSSQYANALKKEFEQFMSLALAPSAQPSPAQPSPAQPSPAQQKSQPGDYDYDPAEAAEAETEKNKSTYYPSLENEAQEKSESKDKKYTRTVSKTRLVSVLQQSFPNLDAGQLKKLAANLVILAKRRV